MGRSFRWNSRNVQRYAATLVTLRHVLDDQVMTERFASPTVTIRRYPASRICDVVVVVRGREMVVRCASHSEAVRWARLECKSYKIPEPDTYFPDNQETDNLPLFLRGDRN